MELLRIAAEKVRFLSARQVTDDTSVLTLKTMAFEPLLRWERGGRVRPALFASWEHDEEGRRWRFRIREGATFHDGKPCEAADILGFIEGILASTDMFGMKWAYARYLEGARITAPARDVVAVETPAPFADVLDVFSEFFICREDASGAPVLGTGPWRITAHEDHRHAVLEREGRRIEISAIAEAEARFEALRAGATDVAMNLERMHTAPDFDPRFDWGREVNTLSVIHYLNCSEGLFRSAEARRAVNHAVDVQAIIDGLFGGLAVRASSVVSPHHLGMRAAATVPFAHDRDAAKRLFDAAGPASELVIRTPLTMPEKAKEVSEAVAEDLRACGLAVRIEVQEDRPEFAREVGRRKIGDMAIFDSSPHSTFRVLSDKISSRVRGTWWQGHDDAVLEGLIAEAGRAVGDEDREVAHGRCLARLREDPPWLYLFHPVDVFAARKGLGAAVRVDEKGVLKLAD